MNIVKPNSNPDQNLTQNIYFYYINMYVEYLFLFFESNRIYTCLNIYRYNTHIHTYCYIFLIINNSWTMNIHIDSQWI